MLKAILNKYPILSIRRVLLQNHNYLLIFGSLAMKKKVLYCSNMSHVDRLKSVNDQQLAAHQKNVICTTLRQISILLMTFSTC